VKLLNEFKTQLKRLGPPTRAWMTTFSVSVDFIEGHLVPAILEVEPPRSRLDFETLQAELAQRQPRIDLRVFHDKRMLQADQIKRTAIALHPMSHCQFANVQGVDSDSLFHPKVIYLENEKGEAILGAGSANLTVSGWGRNQEVFAFRAVSTLEQHRQIRSFFESLGEALGLDLSLGTRRRFAGEDPDWSFVHSFQNASFLDQLFKGRTVDHLSVWSPYLSMDLPRLVNRLREKAGHDALEVHLVADRLAGQYFRTPWSDALGACLESQALRFFENPTARHPSTEMTHAKIWHAHSQDRSSLAIGSWNFTTSGTSSFERRNIEAGILLASPGSDGLTGKQLKAAQGDFASLEVLSHEALELPALPPFDMVVCFDWRTSTYQVSGCWIDGHPLGGLTLHLPGLEPQPLVWASRRSGPTARYALIEMTFELADNEALLLDHAYAVHQKGESVDRGMIIEVGQEFRRALGYESLKDLFDAVVAGVDPATGGGGGGGGRTVLRGPLADKGGPDEDMTPDRIEPDASPLTYFRLFEAAKLYRERLSKAKSREMLERMLFTYPGCVQELSLKARERLAAEPPSVFNWFLAQEVNALVAQAAQGLERFRERYERRAVPRRWEALMLSEPPLPVALAKHRSYLREVRLRAGYAA
jgi:hypothetical protein